MRYYPVTIALIALQIVSLGCHRTREIKAAVPQTGPLVGTWKYADDDLSDAASGIVREFVIGDGTWRIAKTLTFKPDGTSDNIGYHRCHFWILDDGRLKLSVGNGNTTIPYQIDDDTLTLTLKGTNDGIVGNPVLTFTRIKE